MEGKSGCKDESLSCGMPTYTHNYLSIVIKFVETQGIVSSRLRITCLCNCMSIRKALSLHNIRHDGDSDDDMSATSLRFDDAPSRSLRYSVLATSRLRHPVCGWCSSGV